MGKPAVAACELQPASCNLQIAKGKKYCSLQKSGVFVFARLFVESYASA